MKFAILGIHPKLSRAELKAVTGADFLYSTNECVLFDSPAKLEDLQKTLGGVIKLGEGIESIDNIQALEPTLLKYLQNQPREKKLRFGMSVYDAGGTSFSKNLRRENQKLGLSLKKSLKQSGRSVRLVTSTESTLSSVVVAKNKLTTDGLEFCLLPTAECILIGVTKTYQDFEDWSHRDYERPARDAKNGMIPPKLARIMVNLSGVNSFIQHSTSNIQPRTLLDPFCGSGTILMEAALVGIQNIIGADISEKILADAKENLDWLKDQGEDVLKIELIQSAAAILKIKNKADIVVTEPFLGKPRQGKEGEAEVKKMVLELETLYADCFSNIVKLMKPGATLVLAAPVHKIKKAEYPLAIKNIMNQAGLVNLTSPIRYERENQFIGRDIWIFTKR